MRNANIFPRLERKRIQTAHPTSDLERPAIIKEKGKEVDVLENVVNKERKKGGYKK